MFFGFRWIRSLDSDSGMEPAEKNASCWRIQKNVAFSLETIEQTWLRWLKPLGGHSPLVFPEVELRLLITTSAYNY